MAHAPMPSRTSVSPACPCSNFPASTSLAVRFGFTAESSASASRLQRIHFDSAGTIRSFAFLFLAASIVIRLSQLGVRPGHATMDSRLQEDCADFGRLRPDRVRSKGRMDDRSRGSLLTHLSAASLRCWFPRAVSREASKSIANAWLFLVSAMGRRSRFLPWDVVGHSPRSVLFAEWP